LSLRAENPPPFPPDPEDPSAVYPSRVSPSSNVLIDGECRVWDSLAITEHLAERFPKVALAATLDALKEAGGEDIPVVAGGIIPLADVESLKEAGVAAVYTPKDFDLSQIMRDIVHLVEERNNIAYGLYAQAWPTDQESHHHQ